MCLKAGEWPDPATFPGTEQDWELGASRSGRLTRQCSPGARAPPIDVTASDMSIMNFNAGGGTIVSVARVREPTGYPGQQARPALPEGFPAYIAEGLLDHLVGR